jgi:hypothetical protein
MAGDGFTADAALQILNEFLDADPAACNELFAFYALTNKAALIEHPHIVVGEPIMGTDRVTLGVLGVINGILTRCGQPRIAAKTGDNSGNIVGFCLYSQPQEGGA